MFKGLLQFEFYYQIKQRAFVLLALLFLVLGVFVSRQGFAPQGIWFNSSYQVYFHINTFTLGTVFIIMFFAVSGVLRDKHHRMEGLLFSSPIQKKHFFLTRFIGVFILSLLAFSPFILGYCLGLNFSDLDPERMGPFQLMTFLQPWLYMVIPNVFICSSIIVSVSILSKNNTATYMSAVFIYLLYFLCSIVLNSPMMANASPASPEGMIAAALADPLGISAFFEQTQYWTPFEKNHQLLSFSGWFMWNRLLWIGISCLLLTLVYTHFSFRVLNVKTKKKEKSVSGIVKLLDYKPIQPVFGFKAQWIAFWQLLNMEIRSVFKSLPFVFIFVMWGGIVFTNLFSKVVSGGAYRESVYPYTNILLDLIVDPLTIFSLILIVFYSAELIWKERQYLFDSMIDATPLSNATLFFSKWIAIVSLPFMLMVLCISICMGFQLILGFHKLQFSLYLSLFYYYGILLFVFTVIALFVHSLVKNKYLGMGVFALVVILTLKASYLGIEHPLLSLGFLPRPTYNNMSGFDGSTTQFHHLTLYWLAISGVLVLLSYKLWQRGTLKKTKDQIIRLKPNHVEVGCIVVCTIGFVFAAGKVFYNTNIINTYKTNEERLEFSESYEKRFKQYEDLENLYPVSMKTKVDIYPSQNMFQVKGDYLVTNRSNQPITKTFITERTPLVHIDFEFGELVEKDSIFGIYLFEFKSPIQPGDTIQYTYTTEFELKGYDTHKMLVNNGTYFAHGDFEPFRYRRSLEIEDPSERKKRGLPKREEEWRDEHFHLDETRVGRIDFETIISTDLNQTALGSGELINTWTDNNRAYFHYKTDKKVTPTLAYFSADYQTKKTQHEGIVLEQYFKKDHDFNVETIEDISKKTLSYCNKAFGQYQFKTLKIAEVPGHWSFGGFAHPGLISMVEDKLYLVDQRDSSQFNLVAKRVIHEVAHQWWGNYLTPKVTRGGAMYVEGFAKYTEAVLMDKLYGKSALVQLGETANTRYFKWRSYASEPESPLYLTDRESYLSYGKNLTAMLALRELLGEEKLNGVIRNLTQKYGGKESFDMITLHFLEALYEVTPKKHHTLIDDWFKRRIVYDLSVEEAKVTPLDNGMFQVDIQLKTKRFNLEKSGESKEIAINEPIQIGLFQKSPSVFTKEDTPLYLEFHHINKTDTSITVVVDERPKLVVIDPFYTRSDENLIDNLIQVK